MERPLASRSNESSTRKSRSVSKCSSDEDVHVIRKKESGKFSPSKPSSFPLLVSIVDPTIRLRKQIENYDLDIEASLHVEDIVLILKDLYLISEDGVGLYRLNKKRSEKYLKRHKLIKDVLKPQVRLTLY
jgi:hypothetical protein